MWATPPHNIMNLPQLTLLIIVNNNPDESILWSQFDRAHIVFPRTFITTTAFLTPKINSNLWYSFGFQHMLQLQFCMNDKYKDVWQKLQLLTNKNCHKCVLFLPSQTYLLMHFPHQKCCHFSPHNPKSGQTLK